MVRSSVQLELTGPPPGGCGSCGVGQLMANNTRCGNGLEKIYPSTAVRFGFLRYIGEFSHLPDMKFTCGAKVVIQTKRGIEMGEQVSLTCNGCEKSVTRERMKEWVATCGEDAFIFEAGRILRESTTGDLAEFARIQNDCRSKRAFAQNVATAHNLPIRIAECEHLFGGERIIFFFTSNERVDFRAAVKELAREYRTRIEMRQIGARDEARMLADFETCGREVCCKVFLKTLKPISMRMAKLQKATLDPSQVSGRCGRLKCCLRYEHEGYEDLDKKLPKVGVRVATVHGDGVIVNRQILTQLVQIRMDSDQVVTVVAEDITAVGVPKKDDRSPADSGRHSGRSGSGQRGGRSGPLKRNTQQRPPHAEQTGQRAEGSDESTTRGAAEDRPKDEVGGASPPNASGTDQGRKRSDRRRSRRRRGRSGDGPKRPAGDGSS